MGKFKVGDRARFISNHESNRRIYAIIRKIDGRKIIFDTFNADDDSARYTELATFDNDLILDEIFINQQDIKKLLKVGE